MQSAIAFDNDNWIISAETRAELARWGQVVRDYLSACAETYDDERAQQRLMREFDREAEAIWARPVRAPGDVIVLAAVAAHYNAHSCCPDGSLLANPSSAAVDVRALAHVVKGILDLAGLKFDADGRLV